MNKRLPTAVIALLASGSLTLYAQSSNAGGTATTEIAEQLQLYKNLLWGAIVLIVLKTAGLVYFLIRSIKQRKTIAQQKNRLENISKSKDQFFANISHELRTPLTLILGPVTRLLKENNLTDYLRTELQLMRDNSKKLLQLIEELLDLSRLETKQMQLEEQKVAFYSFTRRLFSTFESYAQSHDIEMQLQYDAEEELILSIDVQKMEKIIYNLLANAIKFTPNGGLVQMLVQDARKEMVIQVKDTGPGIAPEEMKHIFERFYQAESTKEGGYGGTGIGLALSHEFTQLMNGKLEVESKLGQGSTFTLTFPKKEVFGAQKLLVDKIEKEEYLSARPTAEKVADTLLPAIPSKLDALFNILIVEDNSDMRSFIQRILEPHYNVIVTSDGQAAMDFLCSLQEKLHDPKFTGVHLIITDLMMPKMCGYKLLEKVKNTSYLENIPTIVLTARADLSDKLQALRIGVDDYLTKPFVEEELLARIQNLLHNYEERMNWQAENEGEATSQSEEYWNNAIGTPAIAVEAGWLKEVESIVLEQVDNSNFSITDLADHMALSERQFRRKMKKYAGLTPNQYMREVKLQKARRLLENRTYLTVAEVCYAVGFSTPKYFTKIFTDRFGKPPVDFLREQE